jgi:hypothetical protein
VSKNDFEGASELHRLQRPAQRRERFADGAVTKWKNPMALNLVSLIMQFLTPDMIGRIASALGLDRSNTQTAIGAAVLTAR